jgi:YggT family protein
MSIVVTIIDRLIQFITILVIVQVILSYFMSPFNPVRQVIDRIVEPMLRPIRRLLPQTGMIDFSPVVLIILLQIFDLLLRNFLLGR